MKIGNIIKDTLIFLAITLVLVLILSIAKVITEKPIETINYNIKMKAFNEVCPGYSSSEKISKDLVEIPDGTNATLYGNDSILRCKNDKNEDIGYIVQTSSMGYGGPINIIVGFDNEKNILGVRFASLPQETPGIGMKISNQNFLDSWINYNYENLSEVDTISGATISSSAFSEAITLASMIVNNIETIDGGK